MALDLWLYGDESGKKPYSLVSAYVANPRTWDVLRQEWEAVLVPRGLREVHAVDLFTHKLAARDGSSRNPYTNWSDEDVLVFIEQLASIIRRHRRSIRPIAVAVAEEAFNALPHGEKRVLTSGTFSFWKQGYRKWRSTGKPSEPYMLAFHAVVQRALAMCPPAAKTHLVFDINKNVEGLAKRLVDEVVKLRQWPNSERLANGVEFKDSGSFPGIQMADLRGFLLNRWLGQGEDGMGQEALFALSRLDGRHIECEVLNEDSLEKTLAYNLTPEHRAWLRKQV